MNEIASNSVSSVEIGLLAQLFDQAPDVAFFVKNMAGQYVAVNQSLVERHGLAKKDEVIGKRPSDIGTGDIGRIPAEQDAAILTTGKPLTDHLELHWRRPEEPVWCLTTKLPIRDAADSIIGLIGFSRDVRVAVQPDEIPTQFATALQKFERDLSEDLTPAKLAQQSDLSPARLSRLVKRLYGLTTSQLISKIRLAAGSRMLQESDMSIADISVACGFYDHSAFTRAFHSATGFTPSAFRKQIDG